MENRLAVREKRKKWVDVMQQGERREDGGKESKRKRRQGYA